MAKQTTLAILVSVASIFWKKANNFRSESNYGTSAEIDKTRNTLALREWVPEKVIPVAAITPEELAECMRERAAQWDALKKATTPDGATEKLVFEHLYTRNGKLLEPEYSGNAGFRRASVYFSAMVQRFKDKDENGNPLSISGMIPVIVKEYKTVADRIIDQQLENALQNEGNLPMTDLDNLRVVKELVKQGQREIRVRDLYPTTTAQKLFNFCMVDINWPKLKVYERAFLPPTEPSYIRLGSVRHNLLIQFNNRFDADVKRAKGKPLSDKERVMLPITEEEVENYFKTLRDKTGNAEKIMAKKDIEQISKSNAIDLVKKTMEAVMDDNTGLIVPYIAHADALNLHIKLIDEGKAFHAEQALKLVEVNPNFVKLVAELVADGKMVALEAAVNAVKNPPPPPPVPAVSVPAATVQKQTSPTTSAKK